MLIWRKKLRFGVPWEGECVVCNSRQQRREDLCPRRKKIINETFEYPRWSPIFFPIRFLLLETGEIMGSPLPCDFHFCWGSMIIWSALGAGQHFTIFILWILVVISAMIWVSDTFDPNSVLSEMVRKQGLRQYMTSTDADQLQNLSQCSNRSIQLLNWTLYAPGTSNSLTVYSLLQQHLFAASTGYLVVV